MSMLGTALAGEDAPPPEAALGELEAAFAERLSGVELVGSYTTEREGEEPEIEPDRYEISKVTKLKGDWWLFHSKYGKITLPPLPLKVLWAGDTPVISMEDLTIPKLGTFSFRVMIHGDRYVATWQHGEKGGHMWGNIRKMETAPVDAEPVP
jgi:hypothetical protein